MNIYVWKYFADRFQLKQLVVRIVFGIANCGLILLALLVCQSRIRNNKHSWLQVILGAAIGVTMAIASLFADPTMVPDKLLMRKPSMRSTNPSSAEMSKTPI